MDSGQQKRIESIVRSALERPTNEREAYLQAECGDDPALLHEVRTFLQARQKTAAFAPDSIDAESPADVETVTDIIGRVVDPYIGEEVDGYRIISRLGAGGMGVVYKVENVSLQRTEALKVISPRLVDNPEVRDKFLGEAHALAKIHHPNIVTVFNLRQSRLGYYITMEYAEGENLAEVLGRRRMLPWKEAMPLVRQLLAALDYAHGRGIIHRDIKPNNIMITGDGQVKVLDFGLAKFFEESTRTTLVSGTLYYMSPEQIDGTDLGPRSDLFSVGMTMYELLSGRLPFNRNASEYSIYRAIKEEPFAHLRETAADLTEALPDELAEIVMKALEKKPDDRFESAAAMMEALDAFIESETAPARVPTDAGEPALAGTAPGTTVGLGWARDAPPSAVRKFGPAAALVALVAIILVVVLGREDTGGEPGGTAPPESVTASLSVNSLPDGASIWLDGEDAGLTTPLEDYALDEDVDSVTLGLRKAGFVAVDTVLHFAGDRRVSLYMPLPSEDQTGESQPGVDPQRTTASTDDAANSEPDAPPAAGGPARPAVATGRLTVEAPPASAVLVDDRPITPREAVELTAGSHLVRCGRMPWHAEQIVDVEGGGTSTVQCHFARPISVLARAGDGSTIAADILIDGETVGSTDGADTLQRGPGSYSVSVAADGLRPAEGAVPITIRPTFEPQEPIEVTFTMVSDAPTAPDNRETVIRAVRALRDRLETAIVEDSWEDLPEPVVNYYRRWFREDRRTYDIRDPGVLFETDRLTVDNDQGLLPVTVNYDLVQRGRSETFSDRVEAMWTISISDGEPRILSVVDGQ